MPTEMNDMFCRTQSATIMGDNIYFFSNEFDALFSLNTKTMRSKYIASFPDMPILSPCLYTKMITYKDRLVLIPFVAKNIDIFFPCQKKTQRIGLNDTGIQAFFFADYVDDHSLLLFPMVDFSLAYTVDLETLTVDKIPLEDKMLAKRIHSMKNSNPLAPLFLSGSLYNEEFVAGIFKDNSFFAFNRYTSEIRFKMLKDSKIRFNALYEKIDNGYLCLNDTGDIVFAMDLEGNILYKKQLHVRTRTNLYLRDIPMGYSSLKQLQDGSVIVLPVCGNDLSIIVQGEALYIPIDWKSIEFEFANPCPFREILEDENCIYILPYHCVNVLRIRKADWKIDYFSYPKMTPSRAAFMGYCLLRRNGVRTGICNLPEKDVPLELILNSINRNMMVPGERSTQSDVGNIIYSRIMK